MSHRSALPGVFLAPLLLSFASGCGSSRPAVVEAHGVVLLNKQPLPNATVEFFPMVEGYDSEMKSTAITDDQGRYTLKCDWQDQPGAAVAVHRVVVSEATPPGTAPGQRPERGTRVEVNLPNRPIPQKYTMV